MVEIAYEDFERVSIKRWAAKRDASDREIVQALKQVGAKVLRGEAVDLLVLFRSRLYLLECKVKLNSRRTATQQQLVKDGWPIVFVVDPPHALQAIGAVK